MGKKRELEKQAATPLTNLSNSQSTSQTACPEDFDSQPLKKRLRSVKEQPTCSEDHETSPSNFVNHPGKSKYEPGDLVWAKVSGHPWWPGIVANESTNFLSYSKKCTNYEKFFISFYGNKSTNAWISEKMLEKYKGKNAFENSSQSLCMNVENKAQRAQLAKKYELKVPHSRYQEWEHAIAQADKANHMNRKKRFEHLNFDLFSYCKNKFATQSIEAEIAVIDKQSLDDESSILSNEPENSLEDVLAFTRNRIKALTLMEHNLFKLSLISAEVNIPQSVIMKDFFGFDFENNVNDHGVLDIESFIRMELIKIELIKVLRRAESSNITYSFGTVKNSSLAIPVNYKYAQVRAICALKLKIPMLYLSYLYTNLNLMNQLDNDKTKSKEYIDDFQVYRQLFQLRKSLFKNRFDLENFSNILKEMTL